MKGKYFSLVLPVRMNVLVIDSSGVAISYRFLLPHLNRNVLWMTRDPTGIPTETDTILPPSSRRFLHQYSNIWKCFTGQCLPVIFKTGNIAKVDWSTSITKNGIARNLRSVRESSIVFEHPDIWWPWNLISNHNPKIMKSDSIGTMNAANKECGRQSWHLNAIQLQIELKMKDETVVPPTVASQQHQSIKCNWFDDQRPSSNINKRILRQNPGPVAPILLVAIGNNIN